MEKEKIKKFIEDNKIALIITGIGIVTIISQGYKIKNLRQELYICQGEKKNLEVMIKGFTKTISNLIYQTGKLASKKDKETFNNNN